MLVQTGTPCKWTNDSQRFLLEHLDTIHNSPSQIYHSALPLCPPSSWLHGCYAAELLPEVKVIRGLPGEWGTCSRTVLFDESPLTLSYGNNTIAVGSELGDIIILDAITGSQAAILSGHIYEVRSLAFSPDGSLLVSGSDDETVKLWDMQTGVVKTFYGHTHWVRSVSISSDCTRIASGSDDRTIRLWDIQTGECKHIMEQQSRVEHVSFSPTDPGHLISVSDGKIHQWDISGHQTGPGYDGDYISFSPDHTQFALCNRSVIAVQNSHSREIVAEFHIAISEPPCYPCFSPDGRLVAAAAGNIISVWDIASSDPCLVESCIDHVNAITSLVFSSSSCLISASYDNSVKFWQIGDLSTDPVATGQESTLSTLASIESVGLQARDGIAISGDSAGVVKTWNILTGLYKTSFQTPARGDMWRDFQLIDGRLICIWHENYKIHIWDTGKGELLQTLDGSGYGGVRISGDGSKIFCLGNRVLQAWDMWTWKHVGKVELERDEVYLDSFHSGGSKIWVQHKDSSIQGWDFGTSGSPPVPLSKTFTDRPHLDFIGGPLWQAYSPSWIEDIVTGKRVFQLSGRYAEFQQVQWDGQYLVAGYESGEVVILDFNCLYSQ